MATVSLRPRQYKRLGRLAAKNPERAERVAGRMVERDTRKERGKEYVKQNVDKLVPPTPKIGMKKGGSVKKKMKDGGKTPFGMLSVKAGVDKNPKPTAADRIAGAKMNAGKMKKGGKISKKK